MTDEQKCQGVAGGKEVQVELLDGTIEPVLVHHCKPTQMNSMMQDQTDEWKIVMMLTGKSKAWVDNLAPMSFLMVSRVCHEINRDFLSLAVKERIARLKEWSPKKAAEIEEAMGLDSTTSSSGSASQPAAALNNS